MNLNNVSTSPGVYLWKDKHNIVIYVGKAKNLKKRMSQYFSGTINSFKTKKMIEKINSYEVIICNNENESLILERNLINKYKPFYNINFLDDRKYPYINLNFEKKELIISVKYIVRMENKLNQFFGPYLNNGSSKIILNFLKSQCLYEKGIPIKKASYEFWEEKFLFAKKILSKNNKEFVAELTKKMNFASDSQQFERAKEFKDVITFLNSTKETQIIDLKDHKNLDILGYIEHENFIIFCFHFYRNGSLINRDIYTIEIKISKSDAIRQFINQFYKNKKLPEKIITNIPITADEIFFNTDILNPKQGKYFEALNLALKNAQENIDIRILEYKNKDQKTTIGWNFIKNTVKLENLNHLIMIDNSNTKNTNVVSVIISYRNGLPQKNEYRKYNIEINNRRSDVEYIKQGLEKYFKNEVSIPNLIIVDGGIQQLNEAKKTMKQFGFSSIPIIGLVKNDKHQTECIVLENNLKIEIDKEAYPFISLIQEEVDRFAKMVHRSKSSKNSLEGKLTNIPGIGYKTELKILKYFGTYNDIYNASRTELEKVVNPKIAQNIIDTLKN